MTRKLIPDSLWVCILNVGTLKTTYRSLFVCLLAAWKTQQWSGCCARINRDTTSAVRVQSCLIYLRYFRNVFSRNELHQTYLCIRGQWGFPLLLAPMTWHDSKQAHLLQTGKTHVNHSNNWPMMVSQHLSNDHFFKENLSIVFLFFSIAQHFPETQSS